MQVFNADEWQAAKGKTEIPVDTRHQIEISVSCTQDVQLLGVSEKGTVPLKIGREYRIRCQTKGFKQVILKGKPNCEYGYRVHEIIRQDGEPLNNEDPPAPPMPGNDNLLLQMRNLVNQEMARNRSPVLDPEDFPWADQYGIDDEDWAFEEEIAASQQEAKQKAAEQAAKQTADPSDDPPADPPAAPEAQPADPPPPEPAQAAE